MSELLKSDVTGQIIRAAYDVHAELGFGFLESVYRNAMAVLLRQQGFVVAKEVPFEIIFHGVSIGFYRADLIVESIVVEVKTGRMIDPAHTSQLINYLRASDRTVGLLINFGLSVTVKRAISDGKSGATVSRTA